MSLCLSNLLWWMPDRGETAKDYKRSCQCSVLLAPLLGSSTSWNLLVFIYRSGRKDGCISNWSCLFRNDSKETIQPSLISEYSPLNKMRGHGLPKIKYSQELLWLVIVGNKSFSWGSWSFICPVIKHLIESHLENFNLIFKEVIKYEYWWAPSSHCIHFQWSPKCRREDYHIFKVPSALVILSTEV